MTADTDRTDSFAAAASLQSTRVRSKEVMFDELGDPAGRA